MLGAKGEGCSALTRRSFVGTVAAGALAGAGQLIMPACAFADPSAASQSAHGETAAPHSGEAIARQTTYEMPLTVPLEDYLADRRRVLVVVDYQVDFVEGGVFGTIAPAKAIEEALYDRIAEYQANGDIVIYTLDTHPEDSYRYTREGAVNPQHCEPGTPGWQVYGRVAELLTPDRAIEVRKGTYGSMDLPRIIEVIRNQGVFVNSIELAGVSTTCRVLHNAIILFNAFPDLPFVMDPTTTAGYSDEATQAQLEELESWGFIVKWS